MWIGKLPTKISTIAYFYAIIPLVTQSAPFLKGEGCCLFSSIGPSQRKGWAVTCRERPAPKGALPSPALAPPHAEGSQAVFPTVNLDELHRSRLPTKCSAFHLKATCLKSHFPFVLKNQASLSVSDIILLITQI